jgi:hypothetical protein
VSRARHDLPNTRQKYHQLSQLTLWVRYWYKIRGYRNEPSLTISQFWNSTQAPSTHFHHKTLSYAIPISPANVHQTEAKINYRTYRYWLLISQPHVNIIKCHRGCGKANSTVASSWNTKMSEQTLQNFYVLLVKHASFICCLSICYNCKHQYYRHKLFLFTVHLTLLPATNFR